MTPRETPQILAHKADALPEEYALRFTAVSQGGEQPIAWLRTDLSRDQRFADGLVVLTDQRLLIFNPLDGAESSGQELQWPIDPQLSLSAKEAIGCRSDDPERWIALLDSRGRELASIDDLAAAPQQLAAIIRQELAEREFLPRIQRVVQVKTSKEPHQWHVITDRGPAQFLLREDDIRRLGPTKAILVDMHGVRYYIPDSAALDAHSRRILIRYL